MPIGASRQIQLTFESSDEPVRFNDVVTYLCCFEYVYWLSKKLLPAVESIAELPAPVVDRLRLELSRSREFDIFLHEVRGARFSFLKQDLSDLEIVSLTCQKNPHFTFRGAQIALIAAAFICGGRVRLGGAEISAHIPPLPPTIKIYHKLFGYVST